MTSLFTLKRAFAINHVLVKHGLDEFLAPTPFSKIVTIAKLFAFTGNKNAHLSRGERLNRALTELGPIFVKLGQMLSTRRDLLPEDIANELAKLQDKVEPFCSDEARAIVERELGRPIESVFRRFDAKPLASASVAQVHSAELLKGEPVVIKIIRPNIHNKIKSDLRLLKLLARWFEKYSNTGKRLKAEAVIRDYETTILNELDLRIEAANASQLRRNFEPCEENPEPSLYVPKMYCDYTSRNMVVQEKIHGIPIGNIQQLKDAKVDMKLLAHRGVEIFFTQVFRDSYFHADMHPGNIFVDASQPNNPKYIGIDCGIMGTLGERDKQYLAKNFIAFFNRDYKRIAELHIDSGWVSNQYSVEEFETAIRTACEPIFGKPLDEISFGHFLIQLFQTARRFNMEVQPQLVLLQKTLLYIEGLGRQLYPKLDLWETARPFLEAWARKNYGLNAVLEKIQQKAPEWVEVLPDLPDKIQGYLEQGNSVTRRQEEILCALALLSQEKRKASKRVVFALFSLVLVALAMMNQPSWLASETIKNVFLGAALVSFVLSFFD